MGSRGALGQAVRDVRLREQFLKSAASFERSAGWMGSGLAGDWGWSLPSPPISAYEAGSIRL